jgi:hypothetical protein
MTATEELAELLGWRRRFSPGLTWNEVESSVGFVYPSDFKSLMSTFPSGAFAERFYVCCPVEDEVSLKKYLADRKSHLFELEMSKEFRAEDFPDAGVPVPWGSGDEHVYWWKSRPSDPDSWTVVYSTYSGDSWGEFNGTASQFLLAVLTTRHIDKNLYFHPNPQELTFTRSVL